ncbi:MAG: Fic family protein [Verrucomicrobiota bacterium]|nr:hypothetical protein [Verrucomicrobiota bacterium]
MMSTFTPRFTITNRMLSAITRIERTQPDSPRSPTQRYRWTSKGQRWLLRHADKK